MTPKESYKLLAHKNRNSSQK